MKRVLIFFCSRSRSCIFFCVTLDAAVRLSFRQIQATEKKRLPKEKAEIYWFFYSFTKYKTLYVLGDMRRIEPRHKFVSQRDRSTWSNQ